MNLGSEDKNNCIAPLWLLYVQFFLVCEFFGELSLYFFFCKLQLLGTQKFSLKQMPI